MPRIVTTVQIAGPVATVFAFATTPANWPRWHPASVAVEGGDHPLIVGEQVVEEFHAAGRRGRVLWRVVRCEPPWLWAIAAKNERGQATITYRLRHEGPATLFERELVYSPSGLGRGLVDLLVLRRRMAAESRLALQRLAEVLEGTPS
jgi:uncharacterized protein YndB with AHSA1/START domain